jgi:hypothetical protein
MGATGPAGPPGISEYARVVSAGVVPAGAQAALDVSSPAGKLVFPGGVNTTLAGLDVGAVARPVARPDGVLGGDETDVDCVGPLCRPCAAGKACVEPGACVSGLCSGGVCTPGSHAAGFGECDAAFRTDYETSLRTLADCGTCLPGGCYAGCGNCDYNPANGCDPSLFSVHNCGYCGNEYQLSQATASCPAGTCRVASCNTAFGNCDGQDANECETRLSAVDHCGTGARSRNPPNARARCVAGREETP